MTPLGRDVPGLCGARPLPDVSVLPAPLVIDVSPSDPGVSAGFSAAGCRIYAAVGFNPHLHQLWEVDSLLTAFTLQRWFLT